MMHDHCRMCARYNGGANRLIYDAVAKLPDADYRADRGAFFGSVHGTLNHVLVADRIRLKRLTGEREVADRSDAILHDDFAARRAARERGSGAVASSVRRRHRPSPLVAAMPAR